MIRDYITLVVIFMAMNMLNVCSTSMSWVRLNPVTFIVPALRPGLLALRPPPTRNVGKSYVVCTCIVPGSSFVCGRGRYSKVYDRELADAERQGGAPTPKLNHQALLLDTKQWVMKVIFLGDLALEETQDMDYACYLRILVVDGYLRIFHSLNQVC